MDKSKKSSFVEWFERWEENIRGHSKEDPKISLEEWNKMSPKEKLAFIKKHRNSGE